jgi:Zn finger protein HypA/HybF involved in hydrogenase expression
VITPLHRTLEQELEALVRGVNLECLVCGEFLLRSRASLSCPECGSHLRAVDAAGSELPFVVQAG